MTPKNKKNEPNPRMKLPDLGLTDNSCQPGSTVGEIAKTVQNTLSGNKSEAPINNTNKSEFNKLKVTKECLEKGINIINNGTENKKIDENIDTLSPEHSLRGLRDIFKYKTIGGVYILAHKQQIDQSREDISMILDPKKSIFIEYNPVKSTPNLIKINNFSTEKISELYEPILKQFINIEGTDGNKPVENIVDELYNLSEKIEKYKLHKDIPELEISEELKKIESLLEDFEKIGDMNFVINLINPLYSVSANADKKIDIEMKISAIVKNFENTPFTLVITQVDIPQDEQSGIKPQTWGAEIKDFTLDLPTPDKYKQEIVNIFDNLQNKNIKDDFLEYIKDDPSILDEIAKISAGLYLPNLKEHIVKYSLEHKDFDKKDFEDSFYKYKFEVIKNIKSGALEIMTEKFDFDDIGGSEGLKADLRNLARQILKESNGDIKGAIKKTYLLTGIPGSGKSMIAKAVVEEFEKITGKKWVGVRFNMSKLDSKYVGQTQKNFAEIVKIIDSLIESMSGRIIIWIDELDKAQGGKSDHSTNNKLRGEFLTALEDKWGKKIVVMATANDNYILAPELVSRFSKKYFFDTPDQEGRKKIIEVNLKRLDYILEESEINEISKLTEGFVGREFDDLFSNIRLIIDKIKDYFKKENINKENVVPNLDLFKDEINKLTPSIQENTQIDKMKRYRTYKGKYLDPNILSEVDKDLDGEEKFDYSKYIK